MAKTILSVDRGSSSLKVAVHEIDQTERLVLEGGVEPLGAPNVALWMRDCREAAAPILRRPQGDETPIAAVLRVIRELDVDIDAVGHRIVFGGPSHEAPERVTAELLMSLTALVPFDPLHLPDALAAIREIRVSSPSLQQVACFDTAFHRSMPSIAHVLPLPRELWLEGIRRYGFHGLSYESIVSALGEKGSRGRMIVAHLGNGASLAAIRDGKPVDTTMGFSPLGGIAMGTRPGDIDPGVILYLLREQRYSPKALEDMLTNRSGLLGVSQISADMRTLLELRDRNAAAAEAIDLFEYDVKKSIGAFAAVLGGLDTLVFTGGIGERAAPIRAEIAAGLDYLGIEIDARRNASTEPIISTDRARVVVRVMEAKENAMVARHTFATLEPAVV
jgi:acetate kinase